MPGSFRLVSRDGPGDGAPTPETLRRRLRDLTGRTWEAGLTGPAATASFIDRKTGGAIGMNVAEVAAAHEFGASSRTPERPFMRATFANILPDLRRFSVLVGSAILTGDGGDGAMLAVAQAHAERVRAGLLENSLGLLPLSARTLADPDRDPRGIPLVDTEQILGAIDAREDR